MEEQLINEVVEKLQKKKETILLNRLSTVVGQDNFNIKEEVKRRFPRLKCESRGLCEWWYWDNDTPEGLFLVMFTAPQVTINSEMDGCSAGVQINFSYSLDSYKEYEDYGKEL